MLMMLCAGVVIGVLLDEIVSGVAVRLWRDFQAIKEAQRDSNC